MGAAGNNDDAVLVSGAIEHSPQNPSVVPRYFTQFRTAALMEAGAYRPRVRALLAEGQKLDPWTKEGYIENTGLAGSDECFGVARMLVAGGILPHRRDFAEKVPRPELIRPIAQNSYAQ